jgi:hypothetical protein
LSVESGLGEYQAENFVRRMVWGELRGGRRWANTDEEERICVHPKWISQGLLLLWPRIGIVELGWGCTTDGREASEESGAGELGRSGPTGKVEGSRGVCGGGFVGAMVLNQFVEDDCTHAGLFFQGGSLPIEAEALAADAALDVLAIV